MGVFDSYLCYRFLRLLTTPWDETPAFKLGLIDAAGKKLKEPKTDEENAAYNVFFRLVANLKRLIELVPGGKSRIGTYAAALYLIREQFGDEEGLLIFDRNIMSYLKENNALNAQYLSEQYLPEEVLDKGEYRLVNTMLDLHGNLVAKGTIVYAKTSLPASAKILGVDVYKLADLSGKTIVVSRDDIEEI